LILAGDYLSSDVICMFTTPEGSYINWCTINYLTCLKYICKKTMIYTLIIHHLLHTSTDVTHITYIHCKLTVLYLT